MKLYDVLKDYEFEATIHTIQLEIPYEEASTLNLHKCSFMREPITVEGNVRIILNLNDYPCKNFSNIQTLKNFKATFEKVITELGIKEYIICRVDVAINTEWDYQECYKLNCYINNLDALRMSVKNSYFTNDFKFKKRTLKNAKAGYEFEIYNKELESNGKNEARTRLEYRIKRHSGLTFESAVKDYINAVSKLPKYIDELNKHRIDDLFRQYCYEKENNLVHTFTEFVCKYNELIYNTQMLNGLYNKCMNGNAWSWFYKFKFNHEIDLYTNQDIKSYISVLKSALEKYLKS